MPSLAYICRASGSEVVSAGWNCQMNALAHGLALLRPLASKASTWVEMVPVPSRSPGLRLQPPAVWCAIICSAVQYLQQCVICGRQADAAVQCRAGLSPQQGERSVCQSSQMLEVGACDCAGLAGPLGQHLCCQVDVIAVPGMLLQVRQRGRLLLRSRALEGLQRCWRHHPRANGGGLHPEQVHMLQKAVVGFCSGCCMLTGIVAHHA